MCPSRLLGAWASTERAPFKKDDSQFDAWKWLPQFEAMSLINPDLLLTGAPPADLRMKQDGSLSDLVGYLRDWDRHDRLLLIPVSEAPKRTRGRLCAVYKDSSTYRVVFDRRVRNSMEACLGGADQRTPSRHDLTEVIVPPGWRLHLHR